MNARRLKLARPWRDTGRLAKRRRADRLRLAMRIDHQAHGRGLYGAFHDPRPFVFRYDTGPRESVYAYAERALRR